MFTPAVTAVMIYAGALVGVLALSVIAFIIIYNR